ncbi:MAG: exodeoxyribonuclease VII large subunit [Thiohalomonadales bacterium]
MPTREIYTVSGLNRLTRALIEEGFPLIWVEGEVSNLAQPGSGHIYFTLKDSGAQVRCAMFRMKRRLLRFEPESGMQVLIRAKVSFYESRGEFQLIAEHMEPAGDGQLRQRFEQLKSKLAAEGLFDQGIKLDIPNFPHQLGIITSTTGAAIRDIISVLARRYPNLCLVIYPVSVQGATAAAEIVQALDTAAARNECDLLLIARGGGSLEDLQAFNEEIVARAMFACTIPIITGVGHEVDYTIADFVADLRAPTPSVAAELASPDRQDCLESLSQLHNRLLQAMANCRKTQYHLLDGLHRRLQHPARLLQQSAQRIDELERRILHSQQMRLQLAQNRLQTQASRLMAQSPLHFLHLAQQKTVAINHRINAGITTILVKKQQQLASLARALDSVSPLSTLHRGFAIVSKTDSGEIVTDARRLKIGEQIGARLDTGHFKARIESIDDC